jgi:hypothetical protein
MARVTEFELGVVVAVGDDVGGEVPMTLSLDAIYPRE